MTPRRTTAGGPASEVAKGTAEVGKAPATASARRAAGRGVPRFTAPHEEAGACEPGVPARERIIVAASDLFCRHGITAVGVDAIVTEAATAKATLYKAFGSKERLVEAVLEREGALWRDWFLGELLKGEAAPLTRLRRIFPVLRQWFLDERFFGCPFINAVAEHDKRDDRMRRLALVHKKAVLAVITRLAGEAGARDPDGCAHQIGLLMDGAIVAAMITSDPNVALAAGETAELLFAGLRSDAAA